MSSRKLVYIIEDEPQHYEAIESHLAPHGYTCRRFPKDLPNVLKAAEKDPPDALVVDIFLASDTGPEIGTDCIAEMKERHKHLKTVLTSIWPIENQKKYSHHFDAVVPKRKDGAGNLENADEIAVSVRDLCK